MNKHRSTGHFIFQVLLRTLFRFNPFYKPVVPAVFTVYLLAVVFTGLYIRDLILYTFIVEYKEMALSAWGFLLLMNFIETVAMAFNDNQNEG